MNIKTIFGLNCIPAFATLVKDKAAFFNVYSYLPSKHSQWTNNRTSEKASVVLHSCGAGVE
ncbi:hypothetical protein P5673_017032 [Acropora cervicornis]|uniref:Uncharacterized protein n=1 Tax=Acropora cervicornis TaxID=6130 RepID=A0AAD9QF14_ACRCE|nr:hypothetical protein P5673_017032 [Acropora cervicornis]